LSSFRGLKIDLADFSGARAYRVVHPADQRIDPHAHDLPFISIRQLGSYVEESEAGLVAIDLPSVSLHSAGRAHSDAIGPDGAETISIEFDPAWLGYPARACRDFIPRFFLGGPMTRSANLLAAAWAAGGPEADLAERTRELVETALRTPSSDTSPTRLMRLARAYASGELSLSIAAAELGVSPAWFLRRFQEVYGEGGRDSRLRTRVQQAVQLLRSTDESIAAVAQASGFFDQAHLSNAIKRFLGRTPSSIRRERLLLGQLTPGSSGAREPRLAD
jgi:AraC-like DNA-binding protein